jgi:hypothetical protein
MYLELAWRSISDQATDWGSIATTVRDVFPLHSVHTDFGLC